MTFDVCLSIKEITTGIGTDVNIRLEVEQAPSGFYIASCPMKSPLIAAGASPRDAIIEYIGDFFSQTIETESEVK